MSAAVRSMAALAVAGLLAVAAAADPRGVPAAPEASWLRAEPGFDWSFPRDHWSHPGYRTEWWYVTGTLETVAGPPRRFGYQFTVFRVGLRPAAPWEDSAWAASNLLMGHAALGDLDRGEHRFSEVLYREAEFLAGFDAFDESAAGGEPRRIAWSRGPAGTADPWRLAWNGVGFDFEAADRARGMGLALSTRPLKPLVFQGPEGYSRKAGEEGRASLYYSFTRLETHGVVEWGGERLEVRGESWMDKEFGSDQLAPHQVGWDWFSLRLDDGRELMLYLLRGDDGRLDYGRGTLVERDGSVRYFAPGDWALRETGRWKSAESGAVYPSGWELALPGEALDLRVAPAFAAQENVSRRTAIAYWEGAVDVRHADGRAAGSGYVELTGYGEGHRPGL